MLAEGPMLSDGEAEYNEGISDAQITGSNWDRPGSLLADLGRPRVPGFPRRHS